MQRLPRNAQVNEGRNCGPPLWPTLGNFAKPLDGVTSKSHTQDMTNTPTARRVVITLTIDDEFSDANHEMGVTSQGYEKILSLLAGVGFDIEVEAIESQP